MMEEVIKKFQLTYVATPYPILGGKLPAELLVERTVQIINHAKIPKTGQINR